MEKQKTPYGVISLIAGILSILLCWCYLIPTLLLSITAIVLGNKDIKTYKNNPDSYIEPGNARVGKIMGIIGLVLAILFILYIVWMLKQAGFTMEDFENLEQLQEKLRELQDQYR